MKIVILLSLSLLAHANDAAKIAVDPPPPHAKAGKRIPTKLPKVKLVEVQRGAHGKGEPVKGKFLDYIYAIRPDHKAPGYSISTDHLKDGYAFGNGPYDGAFLEFFLFRGEGKDLVFAQESGYEVEEKRETYGFALEPYYFENGKKKAAKVKEVLPTKEIESLYQRAEKKLAKSGSEYANWAFYRLIRLPVEGTSVALKTCRDRRDPPFASDTLCATVGTLEWDRKSFHVKPLEKPEFGKETI